MTGAGRLSSDPQPVMAKPAPLCLSCIAIVDAHDIPRRSFLQIIRALPSLSRTGPDRDP